MWTPGKWLTTKVSQIVKPVRDLPRAQCIVVTKLICAQITAKRRRRRKSRQQKVDILFISRRCCLPRGKSRWNHKNKVKGNGLFHFLLLALLSYERKPSLRDYEVSLANELLVAGFDGNQITIDQWPHVFKDILVQKVAQTHRSFCLLIH